MAASLLGYSGADGRFTLQPGSVTFSAWAGSADLRSGVSVAVAGAPADLEGRRFHLSTPTITTTTSEARA